MTSNRLLVIDDEPDICDFIREVAEENGFEVAIAENFEQFRTTFRSFKPSVVVLDLQMPEVDGIELLRFLGTDRCRAQILLVSGLGQKILFTAREVGATYGLNMLGTLQKPILVPDLESALSQAMAEQRSITEGELNEAIESRQLMLHYQPKVNLKSDHVWAVDSIEALVRWTHPRMGVLAPDAFIPLAEKSGLIAPLTDFVLGAALEQIGLWRDRASSVSVAVNLAPQLLDDLDLPDRLTDMLRAHDVEASELILEVTESGAMADAARTMDVLTRLRLKGIALSLDDFGTGYSSLVQLHRMPFSELKIDKSFVIDVDHTEEAKVIVRSIVDLAHNLGLDVCAEGVETEQTIDFLHSVGCDKAQGYLISKPIPAKELAALLRAWNSRQSEG